MAELVTFLAKAVVISLSGVMAPGAITAATLAAGSRDRHAGVRVAVGHGIVEFPLMVLIILGLGRWFKVSGVQTGISLAGGAFLIVMAVRMILAVRKADQPAPAPKRFGPVVTGIVLSAGNPYFLVWWATVGLALATEAAGLGIWAFAVFAVVHWLCDLVWLEVLSLASAGGTSLLGGRAQRIIVIVCAAAMIFFAATFLYDGIVRLLG